MTQNNVRAFAAKRNNAPQPAGQEQALHLADNLKISPDLLIGNGNGIAGFGVPGTGKTGVFVRLLEQCSQFSIPIVAFDKEGDMLSAVDIFPRGLIATFKNCPSAKDILRDGLQVVYDLSTWPAPDMAGSMIAGLVNDLMARASAMPTFERVPCLIGLDEAAYWLPQVRGEYLSYETFCSLQDAFHTLATLGRKRGLTPVLFAQKMSELQKTVLSPGCYIFMRQTVDVDLKRYMEYISCGDLTQRQVKARIAALPPGRAIVKLPDGSQKTVQFYERESIHLSHTPKTQAAINKYGAMPFNRSVRYGAYLGETETAVVEAPEPVQVTGKSSKPIANKSETVADRVHALLTENPDLTPTQMAEMLGCDRSCTSRARKKFFDPNYQRT